VFVSGVTVSNVTCTTSTRCTARTHAVGDTVVVGVVPAT